MRAGLLNFAVLVASARAAPRDRRHYRLHAHAHEKRAVETVVATDVVWVTATAGPSAIVYVDGNGNPASTAYHDLPNSTPIPQKPEPQGYDQPTPTPSIGQTAVIPPPAYSPSNEEAPTNTEGGYIGNPLVPSSSVEEASPTQAAPVSSPSADQGTDSGSSNGALLAGHGASYTPYNADGTVKTQDQVTSDIAQLDGYSTIRIYGTDNHQTSMVIQAAKPMGMKVFAGVFDINNVASETQAIIDDAKNDWDSIHTVSVGNEAVNGGMAVGTVVSAINTARSMLRAAGYTGPVVTVDTFIAIIANPELCQNSDYPAANIHPFFDVNTDADHAAAFVQRQAQRVSQSCGNKDVVVTESGWPWQGSNNSAAVPGVQQQATVISGLRSRFANNIVLFSPYDDSWKDDGEFGCEKYWGYFSHAAA